MPQFRTILLCAALLVAGALPIHFAPPSAVAAGTCDTSGASNDGEELAFLSIINSYRAQNGAGALAIAPSLNRAAAWMVNDMGANAYFGHTDSLGRDPWTRIVDCGYPVAGGENLAAGTNRESAQSAFDLFRGSPPHNENMLLARYTEIGIARLYVPGSTYGWYWATTFGTAAEAAAPPPPAAVASPPAAAPPIVTPAATPSRPAPSPTPSSPPSPSPAPATTVPETLTLASGATFITWTGPRTGLEEVVDSTRGSIAVIYRWDPAASRWLRYAPDLPWYLQSFREVEPGEGLWVITSGPAQLALHAAGD